MKPEQIELWQKLSLFALDAPGTQLTFVRRLARDNGWNDHFANRVVNEYRRFLLLAMEAGHVVCPSEEVDQAWHQHLVDSHSYWDELCGKILGRPLHHAPSRGGSGEAKKHRQLYTETLSSYRRLFGEEPPGDIWPDVEQRFAARSFVRVDRRRHWLIPRPHRGRALAAAAIGLVALLATGCGREFFLTLGGPWDLTGPEFLLLYFLLFAAVTAVVLVGRHRTRGPGPHDWTAEDMPDRYETAYVAGYLPRALEAALASLLQDGQVEFSKDKPWQIAVKKPFLTGAHWFEREVYDQVRTAGEATYASVRSSGELQEKAKQLDERMVKAGCLLPADRALWLRAWTTALFVALLCFGLSKVQVGMARNRPVELLVFACIGVAGASGVCAFLPTRRTRRGKDLLNKLREQHAAYASTPVTTQMTSDRVAVAVALFGSSVLVSSALANFPGRFITGPSQNEAGGVAGGCSGGGDGGGGCGGGGGGCGGCGGGGGD